MNSHESSLAEDVAQLLQIIEERENHMTRVLAVFSKLGSKETASSSAESKIISEVVPAEAERISKEDAILARCSKLNTSNPDEHR